MPSPLVRRFLLASMPAFALALPVRAETAYVIGEGLAIVDRTETRSWSSGRKHGLTDWQTAKCWELPEKATSPVPDLGPYSPERGLAAQLIVAREPTSNLDNFIAELEVICYSYEIEGDLAKSSFPAQPVLFASPSSRHDREVISAPEFGPNPLPHRSLPTGLRLRLNPGKEYVKQLAFSAVHVVAGGRLDWENEVVGTLEPKGIDSGKLQDLRCPSRSLLVGLGIRADEGNGKIRDVKLFCREVVVKEELAGAAKR